MHEDARIIGIDLGTTNSVVAIIEGDEPVVIPNQEGSNKTPSVVAFLDDNECIVGEIARRQAATNPLRTISSIKRIMGMDFEQAEERGGQLPFNIVDHEGKLLIDINGFGYSPEQISALVLKKLKESAEAYLGQEVRQAVITVPANFDDSQRTATMEAARLAGLEVLRLLNEPTAAALAYGIGKSTSEDEVIAVYDFGGGTFDVTILEISDKTFEVLCSTGDTQLGGDDLDNVIVHLIVEEFEEQHGVDLTKDPVTLRRLKEVAEKAKCELSTTSSTMITLPFIAYRNSQPLHLERQISRAEFEELIDSFVTRTIRCCKRAIEDAHISKKDVDKVILVGGSTRIPLVQDAVEDFFGLQPFKGINPDEVVALGAATQAGVFSGNIQEVTLLDVSPHSLGIEVKDGKFSRIIEKNATIPIKAAKNFTTTEEAQTFVNVHILQGESAEASENRSLGKFTLADIPAAPKGSARIRVTFFVNADGVMEISAEELASGAAKTLKIVHSELDEAEKKSRKKARARRGRSTTKGGAPAPTGGGRKLSSPPGQMPQELKKDDSSSVRSNKADSSVRPRTPDNFAVLGDATPGNAPTMPVSPASHKSSEVVPLAHKAPQPQPSTEHIPRPSDSDVRSLPSPRRYGSPGSGLSPIPPESVTNPKTDMHKAATPPMPPADPPRRDDFTSTYESQSSKSDTQEVQMESPDTKEVDLRGLGDLGGDVDWPGVVDSALDYAADNDASEDAKELYAKAIAALSAEPWLTDGRFPVLRARALLLIASGESERARAALKILVGNYGAKRKEDVSSLFDMALANLPDPASLRRDRSALREAAGDLEGACDDLDAATKLDPSDKDSAELERLYKIRVSKSADMGARFKLVKIYLKANRVDEAIELLQELQTSQAYETRALKILGLCHWQKNLHFLAWQKFKQLKQNEEIRDILYRLATDMENTGQLNNSLTVYEHLAAEGEDYRDIAAKIKKLRYRIKMQQDETDHSKAAILSDPRFVIIEEINRGSMGIIYKARDKTLEEVVALKVLNDYLCSDPGAVERFKREARAAKKLSHPYIVRIHDMFESGSKRFISMEYIEGTDLKRVLAERTSFQEDQLVYFFLQICDALAYAHKLNIIHRDIKPANIMITKQNSVKVTDFGIAKILKGDDSTKSGTAIIGTPLYMAPEQITGEGVDARTDIYSLGIMMYELTSGHPPFYLGNIEYHHIHTAPPPLPDRVSPALQAVIMKCVAKNAGDRFQSVDEIFDALNVQKRP